MAAQGITLKFCTNSTVGTFVSESRQERAAKERALEVGLAISITAAIVEVKAHTHKWFMENESLSREDALAKSKAEKDKIAYVFPVEIWRQIGR